MNNRLDNASLLSPSSSAEPCRRAAPYPLVLPQIDGAAARRRSYGEAQNSATRSLAWAVAIERVEKELEDWVAAGQGNELRKEAADRILTCFREKGTALDLGFLRLKTLPHCIGKLPALQSLDVSFNALTMLPYPIGDLLLLQSLVASGNDLAELPDRIGDLLSLHTLDLSDNLLTELPGSIGELFLLHTLDVSGNKLVALPGRIGEMSSLRTLVLSGNHLKELPGSIGALAEL
jgi:Leucine-rich repeat (LRR) protein